MRVAVLLQPVASSTGRAMAVIQVADILEPRTILAGKILLDTLWCQALLLAAIALVHTALVQRATRPVRRPSAGLPTRGEGDLIAIDTPDASHELLLMVKVEQLRQQPERQAIDPAAVVRQAVLDWSPLMVRFRHRPQPGLDPGA